MGQILGITDLDVIREIWSELLWRVQKVLTLWPKGSESAYPMAERVKK